MPNKTCNCLDDCRFGSTPSPCSYYDSDSDYQPPKKLHSWEVKRKHKKMDYFTRNQKYNLNRIKALNIVFGGNKRRLNIDKKEEKDVFFKPADVPQQCKACGSYTLVKPPKKRVISRKKFEKIRELFGYDSDTEYTVQEPEKPVENLVKIVKKPADLINKGSGISKLVGEAPERLEVKNTKAKSEYSLSYFKNAERVRIFKNSKQNFRKKINRTENFTAVGLSGELPKKDCEKKAVGSNEITVIKNEIVLTRENIRKKLYGAENFSEIGLSGESPKKDCEKTTNVPKEVTVVEEETVLTEKEMTENTSEPPTAIVSKIEHYKKKIIREKSTEENIINSSASTSRSSSTDLTFPEVKKDTTNYINNNISLVPKDKEPTKPANNNETNLIFTITSTPTTPSQPKTTIIPIYTYTHVNNGQNPTNNASTSTNFHYRHILPAMVPEMPERHKSKENITLPLTTDNQNTLVKPIGARRKTAIGIETNSEKQTHLENVVNKLPNAVANHSVIKRNSITLGETPKKTTSIPQPSTSTKDATSITVLKLPLDKVTSNSFKVADKPPMKRNVTNSCKGKEKAPKLPLERSQSQENSPSMPLIDFMKLPTKTPSSEAPKPPPNPPMQRPDVRRIPSNSIAFDVAIDLTKEHHPARQNASKAMPALAPKPPNLYPLGYFTNNLTSNNEQPQPQNNAVVEEQQPGKAPSFDAYLRTLVKKLKTLVTQDVGFDKMFQISQLFNSIQGLIEKYPLLVHSQTNAQKTLNDTVDKVLIQLRQRSVNPQMVTRAVVTEMIKKNDFTFHNPPKFDPRIPPPFQTSNLLRPMLIPQQSQQNNNVLSLGQNGIYQPVRFNFNLHQQTPSTSSDYQQRIGRSHPYPNFLPNSSRPPLPPEGYVSFNHQPLLPVNAAPLPSLDQLNTFFNNDPNSATILALAERAKLYNMLNVNNVRLEGQNSNMPHQILGQPPLRTSNASYPPIVQQVPINYQPVFRPDANPLEHQQMWFANGLQPPPDFLRLGNAQITRNMQPDLPNAQPRQPQQVRPTPVTKDNNSQVAETTRDTVIAMAKNPVEARTVAMDTSELDANLNVDESKEPSGRKSIKEVAEKIKESMSGKIQQEKKPEEKLAILKEVLKENLKEDYEAVLHMLTQSKNGRKCKNNEIITILDDDEVKIEIIADEEEAGVNEENYCDSQQNNKRKLSVEDGKVGFNKKQLLDEQSARNCAEIQSTSTTKVTPNLNENTSPNLNKNSLDSVRNSPSTSGTSPLIKISDRNKPPLTFQITTNHTLDNNMSNSSNNLGKSVEKNVSISPKVNGNPTNFDKSTISPLNFNKTPQFTEQKTSKKPEPNLETISNRNTPSTSKSPPFSKSDQPSTSTLKTNTPHFSNKNTPSTSKSPPFSEGDEPSTSTLKTNTSHFSNRNTPSTSKSPPFLEIDEPSTSTLIKTNTSHFPNRNPSPERSRPNTLELPPSSSDQNMRSFLSVSSESNSNRNTPLSGRNTPIYDRITPTSSERNTPSVSGSSIVSVDENHNYTKEADSPHFSYEASQKFFHFNAPLIGFASLDESALKPIAPAKNCVNVSFKLPADYENIDENDIRQLQNATCINAELINKNYGRSRVLSSQIITRSEGEFHHELTRQASRNKLQTTPADRSDRRQSIETISSCNSESSAQLNEEPDAHSRKQVPKGKLCYIRESNRLIRYSDDAQSALFAQNVTGKQTKTDLNKTQQQEVSVLPEEAVFSRNEMLSDPEEYIKEIEMVKQYQIIRGHEPISFHTFLAMHNTNGLTSLLERYVRTLKSERKKTG